MPTNALASLDCDATTEKRAQYEAFEFDVTADGVHVRNGSHEDPDDHTYTVTVEDGVATECECPADEYHEGACKHRVAVAIREPVLKAATTQRVATDGGVTTETTTADDEPTYTYHREPAHVGGARYVRCEECEVESVPADPDRVLHDPDCPEATRRGGN